jgi:hypothetical protein
MYIHLINKTVAIAQLLLTETLVFIMGRFLVALYEAQWKKVVVEDGDPEKGVVQKPPPTASNHQVLYLTWRRRVESLLRAVLAAELVVLAWVLFIVD